MITLIFAIIAIMSVATATPARKDMIPCKGIIEYTVSATNRDVYGYCPHGAEFPAQLGPKCCDKCERYNRNLGYMDRTHISGGRPVAPI
jgi:hypothetical protein